MGKSWIHSHEFLDLFTKVVGVMKTTSNNKSREKRLQQPLSWLQDITTVAGPEEGFYFLNGSLQDRKVAALSRTFATCRNRCIGPFKERFVRCFCKSLELMNPSGRCFPTFCRRFSAQKPRHRRLLELPAACALMWKAVLSGSDMSGGSALAVLSKRRTSREFCMVKKVEPCVFRYTLKSKSKYHKLFLICHV